MPPCGRPVDQVTSRLPLHYLPRAASNLDCRQLWEVSRHISRKDKSVGCQPVGARYADFISLTPIHLAHNRCSANLWKDSKKGHGRSLSVHPRCLYSLPANGLDSKGPAHPTPAEICPVKMGISARVSLGITEEMRCNNEKRCQFLVDPMLLHARPISQRKMP